MADNKRNRNNLTVDLSDIKTVEGLHAVLKEAFEFPEYYGGNLDALHDCLTDIAVKAAEAGPVTVTFAGYKKAKRALGSD
ncbi:MAG: barstar family protein, partial [Clostridia bacterium]|nr:barstar family protein [Clostridia bacterium]